MARLYPSGWYAASLARKAGGSIGAKSKEQWQALKKQIASEIMERITQDMAGAASQLEVTFTAHAAAAPLTPGQRYFTLQTGLLVLLYEGTTGFARVEYE